MEMPAVQIHKLQLSRVEIRSLEVIMSCAIFDAKPAPTRNANILMI